MAAKGSWQATTYSMIAVFAVIAFVNLFLPRKTGFSIFAGGIIAAVNFFWLASTLKKSAVLNKDRIKGFIAARYWIRFSVIAIIIFHLISRDIVNPLAFILGFTLIMVNNYARINITPAVWFSRSYSGDALHYHCLDCIFICHFKKA
ncbi:MAG: ATP synthase subunit I [Deltaproteobacteria bacterium]|nr:ATP synthase subunit I [Deltaproteobacteria bacterium]